MKVAAAKQAVIDAKANEKREGQHRRAEAMAMAREDNAAQKMRRKWKLEETRAFLANLELAGKAKGKAKGKDNGLDKGFDVD